MSPRSAPFPSRSGAGPLARLECLAWAVARLIEPGGPKCQPAAEPAQLVLEERHVMAGQLSPRFWHFVDVGLGLRQQTLLERHEVLVDEVPVLGILGMA